MSTKVFFEFGTVVFFDNFAIGEMFEGADISANDYSLLTSALIQHFDGKPFGYISNRIYSYSIDPRSYMTTSSIKNLVTIAMVITKPAQKLSASIEELFYGRPFQYFENIKEATHWMQKTINLEASARSA